MPQDVCFNDLKFIIEFVYRGEIDVSQAELQVSEYARERIRPIFRRSSHSATISPFLARERVRQTRSSDAFVRRVRQTRRRYALTSDAMPEHRIASHRIASHRIASHRHRRIRRTVA